MNNFDLLIERARETNKRRDDADRASGLLAESSAPIEVRAQTAMMALEAAIVTNDWEIVAEAYCLLEGASAGGGN